MKPVMPHIKYMAMMLAIDNDVTVGSHATIAQGHGTRDRCPRTATLRTTKHSLHSEALQLSRRHNRATNVRQAAADSW